MLYPFFVIFGILHCVVCVCQRVCIKTLIIIHKDKGRTSKRDVDGGMSVYGRDFPFNVTNLTKRDPKPCIK